MNVLITSSRRRCRSPKVVGKDLARLRSNDQQRAQITRERRENVSLLSIQSISRTDRGCFLAQASKETAYDLALLVEIIQAVFEQPRQSHEEEQFELLS